MSDEIVRPQAKTGKISHKESFELCYLRHQYLRKTTSNPTKDEMEPYQQIVAHLAKNTFYTYKGLFGMIGFDKDDLIHIGNIHLISFLGLFSIEAMPEKYKAFEDTFTRVNFKGPKNKDLLNKNKANCTLFLKQRMEDVVRVCRQKARNIKGLPTEEFFTFCGKEEPPYYLDSLIKHHEKLGYKKIDIAVYKSIKKRVKIDNPSDYVFKFDETYYIAVPVAQKRLSLVDFSGADMDPYDSIHNMDPEQIYFNMEENRKWDTLQERFDSKPKHRRANIIKRFIKNNRDNPQLKEEIRAARKLLKDMDA